MPQDVAKTNSYNSVGSVIGFFFFFFGLSCSTQGASEVGASGKAPTCQCRRRKRGGFGPCIRKVLWRRAQQPTPVFLLGESHGQRLAGYSPCGSQRLGQG